MLRRVAVALVFALALSVGSGTAPAAPHAHAAKLKACKKGANSKKCRCPKGSKLVKKNHKYRCKKKKPPQQGQQGTGDNTTGGDNTGTGGDQTGTGGDQTGTGGDQTGTGGGDTSGLTRDDAAFEQALTSTLLNQHTEDNSGGIGRYAYNFLGNHQLLYCSYYYNLGQTAEGNSVGSWQVLEGYTKASIPGYSIGRVHIVGSDFDVVMGVEMLGTNANVDTGNASNQFAKGAFARTEGGAVTNCSAIS